MSKDQVITFRVDENGAEQLERLCDMTGQNVTRVIRAALDAYEAALTPSIAPQEVENQNHENRRIDFERRSNVCF
jgi:predicted transcriptional regulator